MRRHRPLGGLLSAAAVALLLPLGGCEHSTTKVELQKQVDELRVTNDQLQREAEEHRASIDQLRTQVANLQSFKDPRGARLFEASGLEILTLSRGADYDDAPGDDGVTVHFRPLDDEGNVVTVGGQVVVQLVDSSVMGEPKVVGLLRISEPDELRAAWHSKFLTNHYTLKCPFSAMPPPSVRQIDVKVEFTDYLTGRGLHAERVVDIAPPASEAAGSDAAQAATVADGQSPGDMPK
ncbi:MAG: hypothetical protein IT449_14270 [Phycisphaerales bacterium]|nr:hypothetical protein [Phycisphaerales bacterium]